jgi:hypothetical protein
VRRTAVRRGENFPGGLAGVSGLVGFYTNRLVEAADCGDGEARALELLRGEPRLAPPPGYRPAGIAQVVLKKTTEVPAQRLGFVWHPPEAGP